MAAGNPNDVGGFKLTAILPSSNEYKWVAKTLQTSKLYDKRLISYDITNVFMVENGWIEAQFQERQAELATRNSRLEKLHVFVGAESFQAARDVLCKDGLKIGNSKESFLGKPSDGVCVQRFSDVLSSQLSELGQTKTMLILRLILSERVSVDESIFSVMLPPSKDHHCIESNAFDRISKPVREFDAERHRQAFNSSQFYVYEYNSRGKLQDYPKNLKPVFIVVYSEKRGVREPKNKPLSDVANFARWLNTLYTKNPMNEYNFRCYTMLTSLDSSIHATSFTCPNKLKVVKYINWDNVSATFLEGLKGINPNQETQKCAEDASLVFHFNYLKMNARKSQDEEELRSVIVTLRDNRRVGLVDLRRGKEMLALLPESKLSQKLGLPHLASNEAACHCILRTPFSLHKKSRETMFESLRYKIRWNLYEVNEAKKAVSESSEPNRSKKMQKKLERDLLVAFNEAMPDDIIDFDVAEIFQMQRKETNPMAFALEQAESEEEQQSAVHEKVEHSLSDNDIDEWQKAVSAMVFSSPTPQKDDDQDMTKTNWQETMLQLEDSEPPATPSQGWRQDLDRPSFLSPVLTTSSLLSQASPSAPDIPPPPSRSPQSTPPPPSQSPFQSPSQSPTQSPPCSAVSNVNHNVEILSSSSGTCDMDISQGSDEDDGIAKSPMQGNCCNSQVEDRNCAKPVITGPPPIALMDIQLGHWRESFNSSTPSDISTDYQVMQHAWMQPWFYPTPYGPCTDPVAGMHFANQFVHDHGTYQDPHGQYAYQFPSGRQGSPSFGKPEVSSLDDEPQMRSATPVYSMSDGATLANRSSPVPLSTIPDLVQPSSLPTPNSTVLSPTQPLCTSPKTSGNSSPRSPCLPIALEVDAVPPIVPTDLFRKPTTHSVNGTDVVAPPIVSPTDAAQKTPPVASIDFPIPPPLPLGLNRITSSEVSSEENETDVSVIRKHRERAAQAASNRHEIFTPYVERKFRERVGSRSPVFQPLDTCTVKEIQYASKNRHLFLGLSTKVGETLPTAASNIRNSVTNREGASTASGPETSGQEIAGEQLVQAKQNCRFQFEPVARQRNGDGHDNDDGEPKSKKINLQSREDDGDSCDGDDEDAGLAERHSLCYASMRKSQLNDDRAEKQRARRQRWLLIKSQGFASNAVPVTLSGESTEKHATVSLKSFFDDGRPICSSEGSLVLSPASQEIARSPRYRSVSLVKGFAQSPSGLSRRIKVGSSAGSTPLLDEINISTLPELQHVVAPYEPADVPIRPLSADDCEVTSSPESAVSLLSDLDSVSSDDIDERCETKRVSVDKESGELSTSDTSSCCPLTEEETVSASSRPPIDADVPDDYVTKRHDPIKVTENEQHEALVAKPHKNSFLPLDGRSITPTGTNQDSAVTRILPLPLEVDVSALSHPGIAVRDRNVIETNREALGEETEIEQPDVVVPSLQNLVPVELMPIRTDNSPSRLCIITTEKELQVNSSITKKESKDSDIFGTVVLNDAERPSKTGIPGDPTESTAEVHFLSQCVSPTVDRRDGLSPIATDACSDASDQHTKTDLVDEAPLPMQVEVDSVSIGTVILNDAEQPSETGTPADPVESRSEAHILSQCISPTVDRRDVRAPIATNTCSDVSDLHTKTEVVDEGPLPMQVEIDSVTVGTEILNDAEQPTETGTPADPTESRSQVHVLPQCVSLTVDRRVDRTPIATESCSDAVDLPAKSEVGDGIFLPMQGEVEQERLTSDRLSSARCSDTVHQDSSLIAPEGDVSVSSGSEIRTTVKLEVEHDGYDQSVSDSATCGTLPSISDGEPNLAFKHCWTKLNKQAGSLSRMLNTIAEFGAKELLSPSEHGKREVQILLNQTFGSFYDFSENCKKLYNDHYRKSRSDEEN